MHFLASSLWLWLCFITSFNIVNTTGETCRESYKEEIIASLKDVILDDFRKSLTTQTQLLNTRFDDINNRFDDINNRFDDLERAQSMLRDDLNLIDGSIQAIEGEVSAITGRYYSVSQLHIRTMKTAQENMAEEIKMLSGKVNLFNEKLSKLANLGNETFDEIQIFSNNTFKSQITQKLDIVEMMTRCPCGFCQVRGSGQCFKFIPDRKTYSDAQVNCEALGAALAMPDDPVGLSNYIIASYGSSDLWAWVGARGNGAEIYWERDNTTLSTGSPLWWPEYPGSHTSSEYCMNFGVHAPDLKKHLPDKPYATAKCTERRPSICEYLPV